MSINRKNTRTTSCKRVGLKADADDCTGTLVAAVDVALSDSSRSPQRPAYSDVRALYACYFPRGRLGEDVLPSTWNIYLV